MDLINSIIRKKKEQFKGKMVILTAEEEERKKKEYLKKQKEIEKEEEVKLGKRLKKLEDYYDYAKLNIKKVKTQSKNNNSGLSFLNNIILRKKIFFVKFILKYF